MADPKTYTISTINRGLCVKATPNGTFTAQYDPSGSDQAQLWTIEQAEDPKFLAFRNVWNGQYLRAGRQGDQAPAGTGMKTWWSLEAGDSPGTWWLKNYEFGNYLCNYKGIQSPNNTAWMWISNLAGWNFTMMWYITETKAASSFLFLQGGDAASSKQKEELDARETALQQRETQLESREKEAVDKESGAQKQVAELEAKEKALAERQEQVEARERAVGDKENEDGTSTGSSQVADLQNQLTEARRQVEEAKMAEQRVRVKESQLSQQAQDLAKKEADLKSQASSAGHEASSASTGSDDIAKLQQRIKELESQLSGSKPPFPGGRPRMQPILAQKDFTHLPRLESKNAKGPLQPPVFTRVM